MQFYRNSSNKASYSIPEIKQKEKLKENALSRIKFIHDRILDHMKMKNFLEIHQVKQYLNQINRLITNVDEIEVYRKKVKNMLLSVNDSIMEFEQAVSSGEIKFNYVQTSRKDQTINKKTSLNSSGLSTLGETSSLSSLALTNCNFQTLRTKNSENSFIQPIDENELSKNTNSIFSSLELTNNDFKTLSNNATTQNNNTEENNSLSNDISNSRVMSQMEVIVSPDLFIQPITISKRKQKTHVNTKANIQEKNGTKEHVHTATHNPEFIIRNYDHVENFNRLSLERSENNTSMEYFTQPPIEKEEKKSKLKDFQIPSNAEKISSCFINNIESEEMSDNSEIYIFNDMNSFPNVETDKGNNNCVMYERDYEICNETKHNKDSQSFVKKQAPIHTNTLTKDHTLQESSREKAKDLKKYNVTISENKSCHSNSLNETKQSEINLDHLDIISSQGVKRRFLDSSTDLKMINGNIISTTENVLVENYSIACSEKISSTSETLISCNKTLDELSKELQEATKECSEVWEDYINLLKESKKELAKSKNTSISEYNNGKLKFPPGYEDHYKHLEEVLFEFKSTIGIPNNINQTENNIISFEDTMNDWQELQQIVQRITKCEKKKKNFNCTLKNNKV